MSKQKESKTLQAIEQLIAQSLHELKKAQLLLKKYQDGSDATIDVSDSASLDNLLGGLNSQSSENNGDITVVEGVFDGYFMIGSDKKKYPVPMNYSSKTKLIPGDILKLRIMPDGKLMYKLINQAPRTYVRATLSKADDNKFTAITDEGKIFFLNQAAVSYFKGKTGDELSIIVNADNIGSFAAIEALIPQMRK